MVEENMLRRQLTLLKHESESDIVALSMLEPGNRKMAWQQLLGASSSRTIKLKQSATAGLTGEALRTGVMQSYCAISDKERFCVGESIVLTEKLSQVYVWPIAHTLLSYQGVIIIGRREAISYTKEQIQLSQSIVADLSNSMREKLFS